MSCLLVGIVWFNNAPATAGFIYFLFSYILVMEFVSKEKAVALSYGRSWTVNLGYSSYERVKSAVLARPVRGVRFDTSAFVRSAVSEKLEKEGF